MSITDSFSIAAWIWLESIDERSPILSKEYLDKRGFEFAVKNGYLAAQIYKSSEEASKVASNKTLLDKNRWYHVAMTYAYVTDGTSILKMYLDGEEEYSLNTVVGPQKNNTADVRVGAYIWSDTYSKFFNGKIDELYVFNTVIGQEEIKALGSFDTVMNNEFVMSSNSKIFKVYPNPCKGNVILEINMPENEQILAEIVDIQGQKIDVIFSGSLNAGSHFFTILSNNYKSGTYYLTVNSSQFRQVEKVIVSD